MSTPMSTIKRKRPINGSSNPNPKTPRPIVATTRASLARANATKTPAKTAFGRRAEPTEPKQLPPKQNANQVAAELKKRPGWDLRGKVSDMQKLIDLNHEQLLELERSRKDLEVTVDEKVSEAKEILEREAGLKAEIQTMERQHAQQIEDLKNQQRIRSQELQDNELIHKRQITNLEIEANDHQRQLDLLQNQLNARFKENEAFKSSIATMTNTFSQVEDKMRAMKLKLERSDATLLERERAIEAYESELERLREKTGRLEAKVEEAEANTRRLKRTIEDLEITRSVG